MAGYSFTYSPRIRLTSSSYLSLSPYYTPLEVVSHQYTNRIAQVEIPLQNGVNIYDARRGGLVVSFRGKINGDDNPEDMRARMDTLRQYLVGGRSTPSKFTFYRYYNPGVGYRYWRNCICTDLSFDDGSRTRVHMPYSFSILSEDGCEYLDLVDPEAGDSHDPDSPVLNEVLLAPQIVILADSAGLSKFNVINSDNDIVFQVDSSGNVKYTGLLTEVDEIT